VTSCWASPGQRRSQGPTHRAAGSGLWSGRCRKHPPARGGPRPSNGRCSDAADAGIGGPALRPGLLARMLSSDGASVLANTALIVNDAIGNSSRSERLGAAGPLRTSAIARPPRHRSGTHGGAAPEGASRLVRAPDVRRCG
jgi:hypothetical protein